MHDLHSIPLKIPYVLSTRFDNESILLKFPDVLSIRFDNESILLKTPDVLSTRFDNESGMNLKLSINLSLYVIVLLLPHSFLIGTEKVIYFSILSPIQLSSPLNSIAN